MATDIIARSIASKALNLASNNSGTVKNNLNATTAPTKSDDIVDGYKVNSIWLYSGTTYTCLSNEKDNAVWSSSSDIYYMNTWAEVITTLSAIGTTYENKFIQIANANNAPQAGIEYTYPNILTDYIVDGGSCVVKVLSQGANFKVVTQPRTISKPTIKSVMLTPTNKPTIPAFYIFTCIPLDGLPVGTSINDILQLSSDGKWSVWQSYSQADTVLVANTTSGVGVTWRKFNGTWMSTADEFNTDKVEYQTGKLWNGKPVYRRGATGNTTTNASTGIILPVGFKLVSCWMTITRTDGVTCQVMSSGNEVMVSISSLREMGIWVGNSLYANVTYYAWVEYTKA